MMAGESFVADLELSSDRRLRALRPLRLGATAGARRGGRQPRIEPVIGGSVRAAVNAGSVVSFVAGLSASETSDVLFSTQLAQRAASAKHDRFTDTASWYHTYTEVLGRIGWVGEAFAFTRHAKTGGSFTLDRSALDVVMAIATGNQLAVLVKTLETLKGLADDRGALRLFELQALSEQSGNFQIGAAQKADNGALSLALGAFHFRTSDARRRTLFVAWGADDMEFWTGAQKLTLNQTLYAGHRDAVISRLSGDGPDYIASLDIV